VLRLRNDPAVGIEERGVRHHGPAPHELVQEGGCTWVETVRPTLREGERLELLRQGLHEVVRLRVAERLRPEYAVDVAGLSAFDVTRARRGEGLDRDDLARLEHVVTVRHVRDALARVQDVPLDRVSGMVPYG